MDLVAREDRALGVGADHLDLRVLLLQEARHAGDRPARADPDDEVREPLAGLAPELGPGGVVVGLRVGRVGVLVGLEGARDLRGEAVGDAVVGLRASRARRRSAPPRPRRRRRAAGRSSRATSCPASPRSRGSPSAARRSRGPCRCCRSSARRSSRPGFRRPSRSAASIRRIATRSLIDPPGLKSSIFATSSGTRPCPMRLSRTSGVSPMVSRIESRISLLAPVARADMWANDRTRGGRRVADHRAR